MGALGARLRRWLVFWWLTVPEPRLFSVGWGVAYFAVFAAGLAALAGPPIAQLDASASVIVQASIGGLNLIGTAVAMASGYRDFWRGERLGLGLMIAAGAIYAALLLYVNAEFGLSTLVPFSYLLALLVVLGIRYAMIRWYTYRPRG